MKVYGIRGRTAESVKTMNGALSGTRFFAGLQAVLSFVHYPIWGWVFVGWIANGLVADRADFTAETGEFIYDMEDS